MTNGETEILVAISAATLAILRDVATNGDYTLNCELYKDVEGLYLKSISMERKKKLD